MKNTKKKNFVFHPLEVAEKKKKKEFGARNLNLESEDSDFR